MVAFPRPALQALSAVAIGVGFVLSPAFAATGTKTFLQQKVVVESDGISPVEIFVFDLLTEDTPTTITAPGYTNPGVVTPVDPAHPAATRTDSNPLLTSQPYTFSGYRILDILNGKVFVDGAYSGDIVYRAGEGTSAEDDGVFNYYSNGLYPTDLIAHARPDDLWNPGNEGLGFSATPSLPPEALDNVVSFGGFAFDVFKNGVFDEPYQLFTASLQPTSGSFPRLLPGDYAGCPGSCRGVIVNPVPGPLPVLGLGAALGVARTLRRRVKMA